MMEFVLILIPMILNVHYTLGQIETVTQTAGLTAVLRCKIQSQEDNTRVLWLSPSRTLLTLGNKVVTTDTRISVSQPYSNLWILQINRVKLSDSGEYTCKTEKPTQQKVVLLKIQDAISFPISTMTNRPSNVTGETGCASNLLNTRRTNVYTVITTIILLQYLNNWFI